MDWLNTFSHYISDMICFKIVIYSPTYCSLVIRCLDIQDKPVVCLLHWRTEIVNICKIFDTVNSCYLKEKGTAWNTLSYPYFGIPDLYNWGKNELNYKISQMKYVIWLLKLGMYWKYFGKGEKLLIMSNFSSYPQYFVTCCKTSMIKQGPHFHFEISNYSR